MNKIKNLLQTYFNIGTNRTGDEALAVACSEKRIFTAASGTNTVQAYNMDGDSDGILTRLG